MSKQQVLGFLSEGGGVVWEEGHVRECSYITILLVSWRLTHIRLLVYVQ